jgi:hypothetical protein
MRWFLEGIRPTTLDMRRSAAGGPAYEIQGEVYGWYQQLVGGR